MHHKMATTPAIAIAAAAKLPTCLTSAAALPVAELPSPELVAVAVTVAELVTEVAAPAEDEAPVVWLFVEVDVAV